MVNHSSVLAWRIPWTEQPGGLYSPWNSPSQNAGVGSLSLLQGIFPGIEPRSPALQAEALPAEPQGSPEESPDSIITGAAVTHSSYHYPLLYPLL